jgi:XisH protein
MPGYMDVTLYLAVPLVAYEGILSEPIGQAVRRDFNLNLVVFDPETEEVVRWIPGKQS